MADAPMVLATSPEAIRDILSTKDDSVDKTTPVFDQVRRVIGASLTDLPSSNGSHAGAPYSRCSPSSG